MEWRCRCVMGRFCTRGGWMGNRRMSLKLRYPETSSWLDNTFLGVAVVCALAFGATYVDIFDRYWKGNPDNVAEQVRPEAPTSTPVRREAVTPPSRPST